MYLEVVEEEIYASKRELAVQRRIGCSTPNFLVTSILSHNPLHGSIQSV